MTVLGQDQDSSDVDTVVSAGDLLSQECNVIPALQSTPSKQFSPSVATNSETAPSIRNRTTSRPSDNAIALQDNENNTQSQHKTPQRWSSPDNEDAQDESMSSPVQSKLSSRHTAPTPIPTSKKLNPFLVQDSEGKFRSSSVAPSIGQDTVVGGGGEDEDEGEALHNERERHSDYSSGTSTPTLTITTTMKARTMARTSPSTGPSSPSTRPMTRSTSKNQFLESLDQDDELEIRLHQQRQPQTTPTHQIGSSQPQPVKRNHTVDLWGRAYYEPSRNSSLTRTPSKKRNAQGESIRFMSPPRRAFDPLSYGLLTQYKLKIPHLSDQEDNDGTQEEIDSDQDDSSALATQEEEEDSFRTPKRKRKSRFPLMKLERPFAAQSRCQTSGLERDEQGPEEVSDLNAGYPDDGADPDKEELYDGTVQDDEYLDEEGPYDVDLGGEDLAGEEDDQLAVDQEAEVQGDDDFVTQVIQEAKAREDVRNDSSEEGNEGSKGGSSVQSTPSKYCQRDRLLHDLSSSGSSHFLGIDFQTPPRKTATRDHFNNLQPPPAPRVPDWTMFSLSDRQSRYGTPGWIPPSGSQAGDSPSRSRSLRTPSFGSKLGSSKNPRN